MVLSTRPQIPAITSRRRNPFRTATRRRLVGRGGLPPRGCSWRGSRGLAGHQLGRRGLGGERREARSKRARRRPADHHPGDSLGGAGPHVARRGGEGRCAASAVAMSVALSGALPASSAESSRAVASPTSQPAPDRAWGHFTRRHALALMFMREYVPAVRILGRGPWVSLQQIAPHWQAGRRVAYPGQERLAMLAGYDVRSIRTFTKVLAAAGLLQLVRLRLPDGTERVYYEPGPRPARGCRSV